MSVSNDLDLHKFSSIIDEYSSFYQNPPKTAYQLTQFCKEKDYQYKYGELSPFFLVWQKQKHRTTTTAAPDATHSESDCTQINWDSFWTQYETKYHYPPRKAVHLWNFAKEEKLITVKYKEARVAFDRISKQFETERESEENVVEGYRTRSATDSGLKSDKITLQLRINKYTKSEDIERIRVLFLECLELFRHKILHDPVSPLQLFNFINEDTKYSVRYADVKSAYRFAVKHQWFKPKKRMKKVHKRTSDEEGAEEGEEGQSKYILEIDYDAIPKEEEKKEVVVKDVMTDDEFDAILVKYKNEYKNPPRNASQIMNFAKDIGDFFKYKACRIAFHRWQHIRAGAMPKMNQIEPGNNDRE